MNHLKQIITFLAVVPIMDVSLQAQNAVASADDASSSTKVYIAKYKDNKACALSFTFDDGLLEHYTLVAPELDSRGLKGTFWLVASLIGTTNNAEGQERLTWDMVKTMSENGHEMSNHSWTHGKLVKMTQPEVHREVYMADSAIEVNTGIRPTTFCYPFNAKNDIVFAEASAGRVATRLKQYAIGQQNNKRKPADLTAWLRKTIDNGDWGITMTHGIEKGYDKFYQPEILWNFMDEVKGKSDSVWVDTFHDVAAYVAERDSIKLKWSCNRRGNYVVKPQLKNMDEKLFNEPLNLVIEGLSGGYTWTAKQGRKKLPVSVDGEKIMMTINPHGGKIVIKCKK